MAEGTHPEGPAGTGPRPPYPPSDPKTNESYEEARAAYIRAAVAAAPEPSEENLARIIAILRGSPASSPARLSRAA